MKTELEKVYKILERVTPIKGDCGNLCDGLCCKGGNENGMLLFPDEEKLFEGREGFKVIKTEGGECFLTCNGNCQREFRPLACRMYPLFPVFDYNKGDSRVNIIKDPRGAKTCPLIYENIKLDINFVRAVRKATKCLIRDEKQLAHIKRISGLLNDIIDLNVLLTEKK
ncbi:MAG TPA: hypothetical protein VFD52_08310 [Clostridia bacterium]|nr:hypothetical protein [Clostridia bacterium]